MRTLVLFSSAVAVMAGIAVATPPAEACVPLPTVQLDLDPAFADDVVAPTLTISGWKITRGDGSCRGENWVEVTTTSSDDRAAPDRLGFEVTLLAGEFPGTLPSGPFALPYGGLSLIYGNVGSLDAELELRAVDLNLNRSAPVTIHVVDDGGCSVGGGSPPGAAIAPLLVVLASWCRRRRRAV